MEQAAFHATHHAAHAKMTQTHAIHVLLATIVLVLRSATNAIKTVKHAQSVQETAHHAMMDFIIMQHQINVLNAMKHAQFALVQMKMIVYLVKLDTSIVNHIKNA